LILSAASNKSAEDPRNVGFYWLLLTRQPKIRETLDFIGCF